MRIRYQNTLWFLALMVVLSAYLPLLFNNLPPVIRSHHIWATAWLLGVILFKPAIVLDRKVQWLLVYAMSVFLMHNQMVWKNIQTEALAMIDQELYEIAVAVTMLSYFSLEKDFKSWARIAKVALICILITTVNSIVVSFANPMFARDIIGVEGGSQWQMQEALSFRRFGGGGYGFYSAIVCILPLLVYYFRNNYKFAWSKKMVLVAIILIYYCLLRVQIFGNILTASLVILMSLFSSKSMKKSVFTIAVIAAVLILMPVSVYIELIEQIATYFDVNSHIRFKLEDMASFLKNGGEISVSTEAGIRAERFPLLWESFLSSPFSGGAYYNHHLHWMNKLSMYGLIGMFSYLMIFIQSFYDVLRFYPNSYKLYWILAFFSIVFLGTIKALFGRELWYVLFVIAPGMYFIATQLPLKEKSKQLTSEGNSY